MADAIVEPVDPNGFTIDVVEDGDEATATLAGELDITTAPHFVERLGALSTEGVRRVVVDMGGLKFIDSSGLSALVAVLKRFREIDGELVLRSPRPSTAKVLEISGLDQVFTIT